MHLAKSLLIVACLVVQFCSAQDSSRVDRLISLPDKFFSALDRKTTCVDQRLNHQTNKYIDRLARQEQKLRKRLWKKDSVLAKQLFDGTNEKYSKLKLATGNVNKYSSVYSGHLDSLTTALSFLKGTYSAPNPAIEKNLHQYEELQSRLNASEQVRKYLVDRQQVLKQEFEKLGMVRELRKFREQVYYYQSQIAALKQTFEDPSKVEAAVMTLVMKVPQFKDFFATNSVLGSIFPPPSGANMGLSLQGLQTRAQVNQLLANRFGTSAVITQLLQQNVQSGQAQLSELKKKASSRSNASYGNTRDEEIPGFQPNSQKTKSFLQRLEYGFNIQSQRAHYFFPVTTDIALSLGYKLNERSSFGLGASYKIGWGANWSKIKMTHQGVGLRTYLDWKIKGSVYLSGGYEQNYRNAIHTIDQLKEYSAWQTSGLIGISKRYTVTKKINGDMKLLWDFLSYKQVPKAPPVLFRIGYTLK